MRSSDATGNMCFTIEDKLHWQSVGYVPGRPITETTLFVDGVMHASSAVSVRIKTMAAATCATSPTESFPPSITDDNSLSLSSRSTESEVSTVDARTTFSYKPHTLRTHKAHAQKRTLSGPRSTFQIWQLEITFQIWQLEITFQIWEILVRFDDQNPGSSPQINSEAARSKEEALPNLEKV